MFESDIERTKIELSELLITHQPFTYLRDILRMPALAQVYKDYFHAEFTWWLYEERTQRSARTHFDNDDPNALRILQELDEQYFKNARFDHEQLTAIIDTSVKSILNYTVRPRTTLKWYVFRGEPTKAIYEVYLRMMYFSDYSYLRDGFVDWLTNKGLSRNSLEIISVLEYEKFIKKIDDDTILELSPSQFTALINPIFDFFADSTKPVEQQVVPIEAIIIFLDDKEIHVIAQKLERMLYQQGVRYISKPMFLQVVDEVLNELEIQEAGDHTTFTNSEISLSTDVQILSESLPDNVQSHTTLSLSDGDTTQIQERATNIPNMNLDDFRSELSSVIGLSSSPLPPLDTIITPSEEQTQTVNSIDSNVVDILDQTELKSDDVSLLEIQNDGLDSAVDKQLESPIYAGLPFLSEAFDTEVINSTVDDVDILSNQESTELDETSPDTVNDLYTESQDSDVTGLIDNIVQSEPFVENEEHTIIDEQSFLPYRDNSSDNTESQEFELSNILTTDATETPNSDNQISNISEVGEVEDGLVMITEIADNSNKQSPDVVEIVDFNQMGELSNEDEPEEIVVVADDVINNQMSENELSAHFISSKEYGIGDDAISYLTTMMNSGKKLFVSGVAEQAVLMPFREELYDLANSSTPSTNGETATVFHDDSKQVQDVTATMDIVEEDSSTFDTDAIIAEPPIGEHSIEHAFSKSAQPNEELQSLFSKIDRTIEDTENDKVSSEASDKVVETEIDSTMLEVEVNPTSEISHPSEEVKPTTELTELATVDSVNSNLTTSDELSDNELTNEELANVELLTSIIENEQILQEDEVNLGNTGIEDDVFPDSNLVDETSLPSQEIEPHQDNNHVATIESNASDTLPLTISDTDSVAVDDSPIEVAVDNPIETKDVEESTQDSNQEDGQIFNIISKVLGTTAHDAETLDTEQDTSSIKDNESSNMGLGRGLSSLLSDSAKEVISATVAIRPSVSTFIESKQRETFIKKLCSRNESRFDELIAKLDKTNNWKQALASLDQFYAEQGVDPQSSVSGELKMAVYKRFINS